MRKALMIVVIVILSISGCDIIDDLKPVRRITYTVSSHGLDSNTSDNKTWVFYTDENGNDQQTEINSRGGRWTYTGYFEEGEYAYVSFNSVVRTGTAQLTIGCTDCENAEFINNSISKSTDLTLLSANELSIYVE